MPSRPTGILEGMRTTLGPLEVHPLCLGGNVFGWSADESASHAVLDAYVAGGGNFIDTADVYSAWVDGHSGGESESVIGAWLEGREDADDIVIATKVGMKPDRSGASRDTILAACDESLERLGREHIDLYYVHRDDPSTPLAETLGALDELVKAGKVRAVALSNYEPDRLTEALRVCDEGGFTRPVALQPEYNLMDRAGFEDTLAPVLLEQGLGCVPYYALAKGFLSGKYRPGTTVESVRAQGASAYLEDPRGPRALEALDEIAQAHDAPVAAVALAWLVAQPTVVAPIASARTTEQLADLLPMAELTLSDDELATLTAASS